MTEILSKEERQAKRDLRRQQQRAANIGRAAKFHAARAVLKSSPEVIASPLERDQGLPKYVVGCSGWFYWHWRENFYPSGLPTSLWFKHYAKHFSTVELNAPFYSWPTINTVQSWNRQVGNDAFIYTVKVSELITHIKKFEGTKTLIRDFCYIGELLGKRLGCFLFQLPPSFNYTPSRLRKIVSQLDRTRRNVVEFRHRSWWNEAVISAFRDSGTIFCSCSAPHLPDDLVKTAEEIYVRFHGVRQWYRHNYSDAELSLWADRIRNSGAKSSFCYFNNDRDGFAIKNAELLLQLLQN